GEIHWTLAQYGISGRGETADTAERYCAMWEHIGGRVLFPYSLAAIADMHASMGNSDKAAAGFAAAEKLAHEEGVCFYEAERLRLSALALPVTTEESLALLRQAWELARRQGALLYELRAALELTRRTEDPRWAAHL